MTSQANGKRVGGGVSGEQEGSENGRAPALHRPLAGAKASLKRFSGPVVGALVFGAAAWGLYGELQGFRYEDVAGYLSSLSPRSMLLAFWLTVLSYVAFVGHDVLALRYVRHPLALRQVVPASTIGFGVSNAVGQAWLSGGAVRYRLYRRAGLSAGEIGRVVGFSVLAFWLGYIALGAVLFPLGEPPVSGAALGLWVSLRALGWVCLAVVGLYLGWCATGQSVRAFYPPPLPLALTQITLAVVRTALTGGVLYVLLWGAPGVHYPEVLGAFVLAIAAGGLGMVPGAAGVLEAVVLLVLSTSMPATSIVGALVLFRTVYYLLPLALAVGAFALLEARRWREGRPKGGRS